MSENFSHLHVEFYSKPRENKRKSVKAGHAVYDDIEMAKIRIAGDPKTVIEVPAHGESTVRGLGGRRLTYAEAHAGPYEAWKAGQDDYINGTALAVLPFVSKGKELELKQLGIHTAEALAGLEGDRLKKVGPYARDLKDQATEFLQKAEKTSAITELSNENSELKARMDALMEQMAALQGASKTVAEPVAEPSQFNSWRDDDLRNYIEGESQGKKKPHHKTGHAKLVEMADEVAADIQSEKAA